MRNFPATFDQSGSAMVISLLVLLVLTMLGTLLMAQSNVETNIAGHDMRCTQALYAAEAGYAEVLARMSDSRDSTNYIGRPLGDHLTNPGWGTYLVAEAGNSAADPDYDETLSDGLDNDLDGQIDEEGEHYAEVFTSQGENAIDYPWVKLHYKRNATGQVIVYGDHDTDMSTPATQNLTTGIPVLVVTSNGARGTADCLVEIEAIKHPAWYYDAAMYVEDDDFSFQGTSWMISGEDFDPYTGLPVVGGDLVPGIATTTDPNDIEADLMMIQTNNIPGEGGSPSILPADYDLDLAAIAAEYAPLADLVIAPGNIGTATWGGLDDYMVVHCPGSLQITGQVSGGGVLIVEGDLKISGQLEWYGLVICLGDISIMGGGLGIHIYGCTMVQGGLITQTVSGNADIVFSSEALARVADVNPYVMIRWHEL